MENIAFDFWQAGTIYAKPPQFRTLFRVQRDTFDNGQCSRTDVLELWLLDARAIDALLARWNRQPTSPVTGRAYHYRRLYA